MRKGYQEEYFVLESVSKNMTPAQASKLQSGINGRNVGEQQGLFGTVKDAVMRLRKRLKKFNMKLKKVVFARRKESEKNDGILREPLLVDRRDVKTGLYFAETGLPDGVDLHQKKESNQEKELSPKNDDDTKKLERQPLSSTAIEVAYSKDEINLQQKNRLILERLKLPIAPKGKVLERPTAKGKVSKRPTKKTGRKLVLGW